VQHPHHAPEGRVITIGPLPIRVTYLLAPAVLAVIAALVGAGSLVALLPPEARMLRCTRAGETITCEEWSGAQLVRRFDGPAGALTLLRVGGHQPKRCLALGEELVCGPSAEQHVARVRALASGGSVALDVTPPRSWILIGVGVLFAAMLLLLAALQLARTLGRRRRVAVVVRPRDLQRLSPPGAPILRTPWEAVRVARLGRPGRGEYPRAVIEYWDGTSWDTLGTWTAFDPNELEPHAAQLRAALTEIPRSAG
jgi:hypothetical protein